METRKHIIKLPENKVAENISVKTENSKIVVNYNLKEKFDLKKGEIYCAKIKDFFNCFIFIYDKSIKHYIYSYVTDLGSNFRFLYDGNNNPMTTIDQIESLRLATLEEKQKLFKSLSVHNKQWNAEKMCIEDIFDPKDGDFLVKAGFVFIYKNPINSCFYQKVCGCYCGQAESTLNIDKCSFWTDFEGCRYATKSEKQAFLDELEKYGYTWNAEKKCLEEYVWKPEKDVEYFYIGINLKVYSTIYYDTYVDHQLILAENYFQTEEQAEKKAKELKEVLKKK